MTSIINNVNFNLEELGRTIKCFKADDVENAYGHFEKFRNSIEPGELSKTEGKIYRKHWQAMGSPSKESHPGITRDDFGKMAFYNRERWSSPNEVKAQTLERYFKSLIKCNLIHIAKKFRSGKADEALADFKQLFQLSSELGFLRDIEHRIYNKMWVVMGKPIQQMRPSVTHDDHGLLAFHDLLGPNSSNIKKAKALEASIREMNYEKISTFCKLKWRAEYYYEKKSPFIAVDTSHISPTSTQDLLGKLLDQFQGICIGELHSDPSSKELIIQNLDYFKSKGVTTFFMEQLCDHMQDDLDIFNEGGPLSQQLDDNLIFGDRHGFTYPFSYRGLLDKARENGLRIVAIDTIAAYPEDEHDRLKLMNYAAAKIIEHEKGGGKYIALMGRNHLNNHTQQMPGICEMVHCPSIAILQNGSNSNIQQNITLRSPTRGKMTVNFALSKAVF